MGSPCPWNAPHVPVLIWDAMRPVLQVEALSNASVLLAPAFGRFTQQLELRRELFSETGFRVWWAEGGRGCVTRLHAHPKRLGPRGIGGFCEGQRAGTHS